VQPGVRYSEREQIVSSQDVAVRKKNQKPGTRIRNQESGIRKQERGVLS
jgi:hypothetical protein